MQRWIVGALASERVQAKIGLAHVGWFTPTRLMRITLGPIGKQRLLDVDMVRSDQSLWTTVWNGFDIDHLDVIRPQIHIWIDADGSKNYKFPGRIPRDIDPNAATRTLPLIFEDAELWLKARRMTGEKLMFRGRDLKGALHTGPEGRKLVFDACRLYDHVKVSPQICADGLKYIVPILSAATWTKGEFSLDIDSCAIYFDAPRRTVVTGKLYIHGIEAGFKNDLIATVRKQLAMILGTNEFESIRLAKNSVVRFQVRNGLVWHEGLEIGLPEISPALLFRSRGSVSFNEELNLTISVPKPLYLISNGPIVHALSAKPLTLYAHGTISDPKWRLVNHNSAANVMSTLRREKPILSFIDGLVSPRPPAYKRPRRR